MLFALRFDLRNPAFAGVPHADRYQAVIEMAEWADSRGGVYIGLSEHHGSEDGYLPSPLVLASAIAARTRNVGIGVNALIAPFYDPIRLAEDVAVLDNISRGRFSLTVAGGYLPHEFGMYGVETRERPARVTEAVQTMKSAWTGKPFEFRGTTVQVFPEPFTEGGPTITLGGTSEAAARRAARIADGFIPSEAACWEHYRDECRKLGKEDPGPCPLPDVPGAQVVLAEDPEAAWPELGPYFLHETNVYGSWEETRAVGEPAYRRMADIDEVRASGQYRILTPDDYAAEAAEAGFAMFHPMVGGIPPELAWRHLHLFEEHFLSS